MNVERQKQIPIKIVTFLPILVISIVMANKTVIRTRRFIGYLTLHFMQVYNTIFIFRLLQRK